jgi:(E)-4-hydroxy-3-methylbut-2-enyl-diphosphate synthase
MVYANRLLVKKMQEEEMVYPLHLGITEAGEGEAGRIKSTIGIASLLNDGIGDTIRVSLTEDPEFEIPVAKKIINYFSDRTVDLPVFTKTLNYWPTFEFEKRVSLPSENIGGHHVPVVIISLSKLPDKKNLITETGHCLDENGNVLKGPLSADYIYLKDIVPTEGKLTGCCVISEYENWKTNKHPGFHHFPVIDLKTFPLLEHRMTGLHFLRVSASESDKNLLEILDTDIFGVILLELTDKDALKNGKVFFNHLSRRNCRMPVILHKKYRSGSKDDLIIKASGELGPLLLEGLGNGIWIEEENPEISPSFTREIGFGILQSSGMRISKTEFISCPGCGRTLFDLQTITAKVKAATCHLKGLRIAIMGCIVNGPGEMSDADYGYVGAGPGKVSLFRGKEPVKKSIPEDNALEELINLIKEDGNWVENS